MGLYKVSGSKPRKFWNSPGMVAHGLINIPNDSKCYLIPDFLEPIPNFSKYVWLTTLRFEKKGGSLDHLVHLAQSTHSCVDGPSTVPEDWRNNFLLVTARIILLLAHDCSRPSPASIGVNCLRAPRILWWSEITTSARVTTMDTSHHNRMAHRRPWSHNKGADLTSKPASQPASKQVDRKKRYCTCRVRAQKCE